MEYPTILSHIKTGAADWQMLWPHIFWWQVENNPTYQKFLQLLGWKAPTTMTLQDIPFCPISLFKHREIKSGSWKSDQYFLSSGTSQMTRSQHWVRDEKLYHRNAQYLFNNHFGSVADYDFLGLLPNYQSNPHSSLISMVSYFMAQSNYEGAYYLNDYEGLQRHIVRNEASGIRTILFGVSFALLDYAERYKHEKLKYTTIIETGGMKRYRREMTRQAIHHTLRNCFTGATIHSEYGMSECFSQLYTGSDGRFMPNNRMRIVITDPTDSLHVLPHGQRGRINIVDIANIDTLSFIATDDLGVVHADQSIEILGRLDNAELRGCNYLL